MGHESCLVLDVYYVDIALLNHRYLHLTMYTVIGVAFVSSSVLRQSVFV